MRPLKYKACDHRAYLVLALYLVLMIAIRVLRGGALI